MNLKTFLEKGCGINICSVIYKFTNIVNRKIYIGQTKNSLHKRLISHLSQSRTNTKSKKNHLLYAIQKYGIQQFDIDVVESGYIWMKLKDYNLFKIPEPVIVQLDNTYNLLLYFYDYKTANIRIYELTGKYGNLKFTANLRFTKTKGTKKAGYIWMTYTNYLTKLNLSNE